MTPQVARDRVRIVIADESPFVTSGLHAALEAGGLVVVAACASAEQLFVTTTALAPDAVLLSATLPGGAAQVVRRLRIDNPLTEFVLLAGDADRATLMEMITSGVHGILAGDTDPARLPLAVLGVIDGEAAFPRRLVRAMADELSRRDDRRRLTFSDGTVLTPRESAVMEALARGTPAAEVAVRLAMNPATIRRHVANATAKLGQRDRAGALLEVRRHLDLETQDADNGPFGPDQRAGTAR